jgi:hypothetical protein
MRRIVLLFCLEAKQFSGENTDADNSHFHPEKTANGKE